MVTGCIGIGIRIGIGIGIGIGKKAFKPLFGCIVRGISLAYTIKFFDLNILLISFKVYWLIA